VIIDLEGLSARPLPVAATGLWSVSAWKIDVRLGSKGEILTASRYFPLYPQDQTWLEAAVLSVLCCRPIADTDRLHSITSSAVASNAEGMTRPSALAVLRLTTRSNLVDCSTGRSAGFAPCRIFTAYSAARLYMVEKFTP
jgi:hypothetical protein